MSKFETIGKITPGFGYSINCQVELFTGKTPDEVGYFCEWTYDPEHSPFRKYDFLFKILHLSRNLYYVDRALHRFIDKIYRKKYGSGSIKNIPFAYLPKMAKNAEEVFSKSFSGTSLLKHNNVKVISTLDYLSLPPGLRDYKVYERAMFAIEESPDNNLKLIISQTELDHIAHWYGVGSSQYDENIRLLDQRVVDLRERFLKRFKNGKVIVVSDHGMANVKKGIRIELERTFGHPSPGSYYYFLEGTILRVWTFTSGLKERINEYLANLGIGSIIDSDQRKRFGISKKEFGDIVFLIDEGLMFVPSFWGGKISKAMHGYHPDLESQKGIFLYSNEEKNYYLKNEMTSIEVYNFLKSLF